MDVMLILWLPVHPNWKCSQHENSTTSGCKNVLNMSHIYTLKESVSNSFHIFVTNWTVIKRQLWIWLRVKWFLRSIIYENRGNENIWLKLLLLHGLPSKNGSEPPQYFSSILVQALVVKTWWHSWWTSGWSLRSHLSGHGLTPISLSLFVYALNKQSARPDWQYAMPWGITLGGASKCGSMSERTSYCTS